MSRRPISGATIISNRRRDGIPTPISTLDQNLWLYNSGYYYLADRTRFQTNASLTHYAEDFITGNHDFKFGVEIERSTCRSRYGFTGSGGPLGDFVYYTDYWSYNQYYGYNTGNYLAYQYEGYDFNAPYTRLEGFAQDSWQITPRININAGVRFSQNWGQVEGKGTVWNSRRIAPRIGFTFDIFGDKSTIFKAHYGQFTEGMFAAYHEPSHKGLGRLHLLLLGPRQRGMGGVRPGPTEMAASGRDQASLHESVHAQPGTGSFSGMPLSP